MVNYSYLQGVTYQMIFFIELYFQSVNAVKCIVCNFKILKEEKEKEVWLSVKTNFQ